jgi:hypothetical protein
VSANIALGRVNVQQGHAYQQFLKVQALGQKISLALSKDAKTVLRSLMVTPFNQDARSLAEDIPTFIDNVKRLSAPSSGAPAAAPAASSGAPAAAPAASSGAPAAAPAPPSGDGEAAASAVAA